MEISGEVGDRRRPPGFDGIDIEELARAVFGGMQAMTRGAAVWRELQRRNSRIKRKRRFSSHVDGYANRKREIVSESSADQTQGEWSEDHLRVVVISQQQYSGGSEEQSYDYGGQNQHNNPLALSPLAALATVAATWMRSAGVRMIVVSRSEC